MLVAGHPTAGHGEGLEDIPHDAKLMAVKNPELQLNFAMSPSSTDEQTRLEAAFELLVAVVSHRRSTDRRSGRPSHVFLLQPSRRSSRRSIVTSKKPSLTSNMHKDWPMQTRSTICRIGFTGTELQALSLAPKNTEFIRVKTPPLHRRVT